MRRLLVDFDDGLYALLTAESVRTGRSIGELARAALDVEYGKDSDEGGFEALAAP